jgi:teichoic acid transport system ATP-binding protein
LKQPKVIFENVTKEFTLYRKQSDKLLGFFKLKDQNRNFTALKNVSFEVYSGETIGIIGINGSGKSTLSNLLAQIVPPTSGTIQINGETSLIAISAGLNNQLSGLENIRLKCLMHGLGKEEIKEITPKIIEFADIGSFIDQPVKNYSSGMRSRLGFAISVHTNPDILVVDEALSVGDQTFYKKCTDKINEFKKEGNTIFFISHSLAQMKRISDRIMWLHFGEIKEFGETELVVKKYQDFINWFNKLSEEEKKKYKKEMFHRQTIQQYDADMPGRISRLQRKSKKKKINTPFFLQFTMLSCLLFFSMFLMLNKNISAKLLASVPYKQSQINVGQKEIQELKEIELNKDGLIKVRSAEVFKDLKMSQKDGELHFADRVKVVSKVSQTLFKIKYNGLEGYTPAANIKIEDEIMGPVNVTVEDLLPILNQSFNNSFEYFLAFLGTDESNIKEKMRDVTEGNIEGALKELNLDYFDVTYLVNETGTVAGLTTVANHELPQELKNKIRENAIVTEDEKLWMFKSNQYSFYLDLNEGILKIFTIGDEYRE